MWFHLVSVKTLVKPKYRCAHFFFFFSKTEHENTSFEVQKDLFLYTKMVLFERYNICPHSHLCPSTEHLFDSNPCAKSTFLDAVTSAKLRVDNKC